MQEGFTMKVVGLGGCDCTILPTNESRRCEIIDTHGHAPTSAQDQQRKFVIVGRGRRAWSGERPADVGTRSMSDKTCTAD